MACRDQIEALVVRAARARNSRKWQGLLDILPSDIDACRVCDAAFEEAENSADAVGKCLSRKSASLTGSAALCPVRGGAILPILLTISLP